VVAAVVLTLVVVVALEVSVLELHWRLRLEANTQLRWALVVLAA
jgi:hypothetical protein